MSPIGYNDFGGYALFQSVQEYKSQAPVPEPGPQPDAEYATFSNSAVCQPSLWQRSTGWLTGLFRAKRPEIADQC